MFDVFAANFTLSEHAVVSCLLSMDFAVRPGFSEDGKKIVLVAQGGYFATVALEDIRKEFGVPLPDEILHDLASQREANRRTLSEIATNLFEAKQFTLVQRYLPVADSSRNVLAGRRNQFAWGRTAFPEGMGILEPDPPKISASEQERVGLVYGLAALAIKGRLEKGEQLRTDALFRARPNRPIEIG